ncbi:MAG: putative membrane protein [Candidatus Jettenia ecosi]|uniref:Putative membrane protein n=1 Tax=Candidatus Jettenia ecosi TaxID=2494326 RepID=A0A533QAC5_9BACT|nr:MAG: putative membrane protein [Candidatus Jettenia ecosi]
MAGIGVGVFSSMLGVAGGELIIPTIMLLFSVDIKLAGSLSLAISIPTIMLFSAIY